MLQGRGSAPREGVVLQGRGSAPREGGSAPRERGVVLQPTSSSTCCGMQIVILSLIFYLFLFFFTITAHKHLDQFKISHIIFTL